MPNIKMLPYSKEAEKAVLGITMLFGKEYADKLVTRLNHKSFYDRKHQFIFQAIEYLLKRDETVDAITVSDALRGKNAINAAGGYAYLTSLTSFSPSNANFDTYIQIIHDKSTMRRVIELGHNMMDKGFSSEESECIVDEVESLVMSLGQESRRGREEFLDMKRACSGTFDYIEKMFERRGVVSGVPTGIDHFDFLTGGYQPTDLIVLAARPAMGKTTFALNNVLNAAQRGIPSAIFSLEMGYKQLVLKLMAAVSGINTNEIRKGNIVESDWTPITRAIGKISNIPIYICDTGGMTFMEMRSRIRRLVTEYGVKFVMVDYIQLISSFSGGKAESRQLEVSAISRGLKLLAVECDIPILALSQLSRSCEARTDRRPLLSDLRDCVVGDTKVSIGIGKEELIKNLVGKKTKLLSVDETGMIIESNCDKVWAVGKRKVYRVTLKTGNEIIATGKHKLLSVSDWKNIDDLNVGDYVYKSTCDKYGIYLDSIVKKEYVGIEDVYDITVEGTHCYLANGIVVHNSGAIEQDADIVAFLYRENYYDKESRDTTAECEIAKQRNGPTGIVYMQFDPTKSLFSNPPKPQTGNENPMETEEVRGER